MPHKHDTRDQSVLKQIKKNTKAIVDVAINLLKEQPDNPQTIHSSLATQYHLLGVMEYATEGTLARDYFQKHVEESLELFRLRGTELDHFGYEASGRGLLASGQVDYSSTNSNRNLRSVFVSLSLGNFCSAKDISLRAWDPPDAKYISARSLSCRPYDSVLAGAVKSLLHGDGQSAELLLSGLQLPQSEMRATYLCRGLVGLIQMQSADVAQSIGSLLEWHQNGSESREPYEFTTQSDYHLCFWAIGLANWALRDGFLNAEDLPPDCSEFPHSWLSATYPERG